MVQIIEADLEIKITIKCYDLAEHGKHYLGSLEDYKGMKYGIYVQCDTAQECVTEIGKSIEALEAYRKHQKKVS